MRLLALAANERTRRHCSCRPPKAGAWCVVTARDANSLWATIRAFAASWVLGLERCLTRFIMKGSSIIIPCLRVVSWHSPFEV